VPEGPAARRRLPSQTRRAHRQACRRRITSCGGALVVRVLFGATLRFGTEFESRRDTVPLVEEEEFSPCGRELKSDGLSVTSLSGQKQQPDLVTIVTIRAAQCLWQPTRQRRLRPPLRRRPRPLRLLHSGPRRNHPRMPIRAVTQTALSPRRTFPPSSFGTKSERGQNLREASRPPLGLSFFVTRAHRSHSLA
jgi:hypothetical protein